MSLILIIEEDKDSRALMKRLLAEQGYDAVDLQGDAESLEWLKQNLPDLVIVGGGKYGEKAGSRIQLLKSAGIGDFSIVLAVGRGVVEHTKRSFGGRVRGVIPVPPTAEETMSLFQTQRFNSASDAT